MNNVEQFKKMTAKMAELYEEKNRNYGNSFDKSLDEDGLLVSKIRLGDKYNRFSSLLKQKSEGTSDESIVDTLVDLANYAIMTVMWMKDQPDKNVDKMERVSINSLSTSSTDTIRNKVGYIK